MKIYIKHISPRDEWEYLCGCYKEYHSLLKNFKYNYDFLIPDSDYIRDMFNHNSLTKEQEKYYHDMFVKHVYKKSDLTRLDDEIKLAVNKLKTEIKNTLAPLAISWGATLPETLTIVCCYGMGGGYFYEKPEKIYFRMSRFMGNKYGIFNLLVHEFIHILIEKPIIKKYKVPQDLKERIVDIICYEFFKKPVQDKFKESFANKYITLDAIKNNLPKTVKQMMCDYKAI